MRAPRFGDVAALSRFALVRRLHIAGGTWTAVWCAAALLLLATAALAADDSAAVSRGERIFRAAGGCSCHTDLPRKGPFLAGGRAMRSPYGTFYSTNITPDPETGLGKWKLEDFVRSMREGEAPDGSSYFPAFPYTSFTKLADADLKDLWAYLRAQPAVRLANRAHELSAPYGWRSLLPAWKALYFERGPLAADPKRSPEWNRGRYLADAAAHCTECHTPRSRFGALRPDMYLAGTADGPEGESAPNVTPDPKTGIGDWGRADVVWLLQTGLDPEGDSVQGTMAEAIEQGYKHLPDEDVAAIAEYLASLPPISNRVEKKKTEKKEASE